MQKLNLINKLLLAGVIIAFSALSSCTKLAKDEIIQQPNQAIAFTPVSGTKNTILTIRGDNFPLSGVQVKVNGKVAQVLSNTATQITAVVPVNAGSGAVEVQIGNSWYNAGSFEYLYTYTVTALTSGASGDVDGAFGTAKFDEILGLAVDGSNNIYSSTYTVPALRKFNMAASTVTKVASSGFGGAEFIASASDGTIYWADEDNNLIRKITTGGVVSTVVSPGFGVVSVALAKSGNIYVAGITSIAKYSPTGTLIWRLNSHGGAGNVNGDTSVVKFQLYGGIKVSDDESKVYVIQNVMAGSYPSAIKVLDLNAKKMSILAGSATSAGMDDGANLDATFTLALDITLDKFGGIYVADYGNDAIRYISNGNVRTVIGLSGTGDKDGVGNDAKLKSPYGVVVDANNNLYISDYGNNKLKKVILD